ncbi:MAG: hypothetical protein FWD60_04380 [Candidatus Azobacteroides sp.]|nr:hypothetical protein [Candidatus Azobacteroides sp.]
MNTTAFCQSYIDLAYQMLAISERPMEIENERKQLKQQSQDYVDYLEKFEAFLEEYPALKTELFSNLTNFKVGAFIEFQLDLFHSELKKVEELKAEIKKEIAGLNNDFTEESKEWLPQEESEIFSCFRYLESANTLLVISFLNDRLIKLKAKKESYLLEKRHLSDAAKAGERQTEEAKRLREIEEARKRGIALTQLEKEERRKEAQIAYKKQMNQRKK